MGIKTDTTGTRAKRQCFQWTDFYEAVAEKLLSYADDRTPLIKGIHQISPPGPDYPGLGYLQNDEFPDGTKGLLRDICPFTTMGTFNRFMIDDNRKAIARELAKLLGVTVPVPRSFEGIPVLIPVNSRFFSYAKKRGEDDIDALWKVFVVASRMVDDDSSSTRDTFIQAYDKAIKVKGTSWYLSVGLYWAHPGEFLPLDEPSREYVERYLGLHVATSGQQGPCDARSYLDLIDELRLGFWEGNYPVHSFPDLSLLSWWIKYAHSAKNPPSGGGPSAWMYKDLDDRAARCRVGLGKPR